MEKLLVIIMVATMVLNMTRDVPSSEEIDEGNVTEVSDEYEEDDVKNHLWKDEYSKIVQAWEEQMGDDVLGYEFIYLDDDEIPELVLHCYDEAWSGFDMYTFSDGKSKHVDKYTYQTRTMLHHNNARPIPEFHHHPDK